MHLIMSEWSKLGLAATSRLSRRGRGCRRRFFGCLTLLLLILLLACALIFWLFQSRPVRAHSQSEPSPLSLYLLLDQSRSLSNPDGPTTDAEAWHLTVARLFVSFLGSDEPAIRHQCGLIVFGGDAEVAVPLAPLDNAHRQTLLTALETPSSMEWTDHIAALALARTQVESGAPSGRPAFVLITDGHPEWSGTPTAAERDAYLAHLQEESERLAAAQIPLFIILLAPEDDAWNENMAQIWIPQWRSMSQQVAPGRLYIARNVTDLAAIYHQIVVSLNQRPTSGAVVQDTLPSGSWQRTFLASPHWSQMTLLLSKTSGQTITLLQPDGAPLTAGGQIRRFALADTELWIVPNPLPGMWTLRGEGGGKTVVWQDYRLAPPRPTLASSPTATSRPSLTSTAPRPTRTPTPFPTRLSSPSPFPPPSPTATVPVTPVAASSSSDPMPLLIWGGLGLLLLSGGAGFYRWRIRRRPLAAGELHVLKGAGTADGQKIVSLDRWEQPVVTIGAAPADVILLGASGRIEIRASQTGEGRPDMLLSGSDSVTVNGRSLRTPIRLEDEDLIQIGEHLLRYENLRRRSAARSAALRTW